MTNAEQAMPHSIRRAGNGRRKTRLNGEKKFRRKKKRTGRSHFLMFKLVG